MDATVPMEKQTRPSCFPLTRVETDMKQLENENSTRDDDTEERVFLKSIYARLVHESGSDQCPFLLSSERHGFKPERIMVQSMRQDKNHFTFRELLHHHHQLTKVDGKPLIMDEKIPPSLDGVDCYSALLQWIISLYVIQTRLSIEFCGFSLQELQMDVLSDQNETFRGACTYEMFFPIDSSSVDDPSFRSCKLCLEETDGESSNPLEEDDWNEAPPTDGSIMWRVPLSEWIAFDPRVFQPLRSPPLETSASQQQHQTYTRMDAIMANLEHIRDGSLSFMTRRSSSSSSNDDHESLGRTFVYGKYAQLSDLQQRFIPMNNRQERLAHPSPELFFLQSPSINENGYTTKERERDPAYVPYGTDIWRVALSIIQLCCLKHAQYLHDAIPCREPLDWTDPAQIFTLPSLIDWDRNAAVIHDGSTDRRIKSARLRSIGAVYQRLFTLLQQQLDILVDSPPSTKSDTQSRKYSDRELHVILGMCLFQKHQGNAILPDDTKYPYLTRSDLYNAIRGKNLLDCFELISFATFLILVDDDAGEVTAMMDEEENSSLFETTSLSEEGITKKRRKSLYVSMDDTLYVRKAAFASMNRDDLLRNPFDRSSTKRKRKNSSRMQSSVVRNNDRNESNPPPNGKTPMMTPKVLSTYRPSPIYGPVFEVLRQELGSAGVELLTQMMRWDPYTRLEYHKEPLSQSIIPETNTTTPSVDPFACPSLLGTLVGNSYFWKPFKRVPRHLYDQGHAFLVDHTDRANQYYIPTDQDYQTNDSSSASLYDDDDGGHHALLPLSDDDDEDDVDKRDLDVSHILSDFHTLMWFVDDPSPINILRNRDRKRSIVHPYALKSLHGEPLQRYDMDYLRARDLDITPDIFHGAPFERRNSRVCEALQRALIFDMDW